MQTQPHLHGAITSANYYDGRDRARILDAAVAAARLAAAAHLAAAADTTNTLASTTGTRGEPVEEGS